MGEKNLKFVSYQDNIMLKKASRGLIRLNAGIEAVAEDVGLSKTLIGNYNNQNHENFIPLNLILNLERDAEDPVITRTLARMQGFVLVSALSEIGPSEAAVLMANLGKETGDVFAEMSKSLADGHISKTEASKCLHEAQDLIREATKLATYLKKIAEGKE